MSAGVSQERKCYQIDGHIGVAWETWLLVADHHGVDPSMWSAGSWVPRSLASCPSAAAAAEAEGRAGAEAAEAEADLSRALSPEGEAAGAGEAAEEAVEEAGALEGDGEGYTTLRQSGWEVWAAFFGKMPTNMASRAARAASTSGAMP